MKTTKVFYGRKLKRKIKDFNENNFFKEIKNEKFILIQICHENSWHVGFIIPEKSKMSFEHYQILNTCLDNFYDYKDIKESVNSKIIKL